VNQWSIVRQSDGTPMYGNKRFYHATKDRAEVENLIRARLEEYDSSCADSDEKRLTQLEEMILACQEEIGMIRAGHGTWKSGFGRFGNKEYRDRVLAEINRVFEFK
jgi:hypothetical protein